MKYKFGLFEEAVPQPDEEEIIDDIEIEGEGEIQMLEEDNQDDLLSTKMEENGR